MNQNEVTRLDQDRLYTVYTEWPKYFRDALSRIQVPSYSLELYESVVFCGMGGSATSSDILQQIMDKLGVLPAFTVRGQSIPSFVNEKSLVIVNSVSGDTTESLLMMKESVDRNAKVISISTGGRLKELAIKSGCYHIQIPNISLPRASLPYLLVPGLLIIDPFLKISLNKQLRDVPDRISAILRDIVIDIPEEKNIAKKIARFLVEGFPFCYASPSLLSAATRFKNSMNENAKVHTITGSILEASHNDIVPFTYNHSLHTPRILQLRWAQDESIVRERFDRVHSLFEKVVQSSMEITIDDKGLLKALITAIYILDLSTIYIAIAKHTDPSPTPAIQILKDV